VNIFVANLSYNTTEDTLTELFSAHGEVVSAKIINDRETGRSKGFGFVEMSTEAEGQAAIEALHEFSLDDRALVVNKAKPREERRSSGGGGYSNRS
jgi:RNA recognition motif-containing protein